MTVVEVGVLLLMAVFAGLAIHSSALRLAIIYLAVFSLLAAFLYLLYAAPELAIAEAVIGSGLVTLLYLAALKRNRVYTIGVVNEALGDRLTDNYVLHVEHSKALREIRKFFLLREYEVQIVFISTSLEEALRDSSYDLIVAEDADGFAAFTDDDSYAMLELEMMLQMRGTDSAVRFVRFSPEGVV